MLKCIYFLWTWKQWKGPHVAVCKCVSDKYVLRNVSGGGANITRKLKSVDKYSSENQSGRKIFPRTNIPSKNDVRTYFPRSFIPSGPIFLADIFYCYKCTAGSLLKCNVLKFWFYILFLTCPVTWIICHYVNFSSRLHFHLLLHAGLKVIGLHVSLLSSISKEFQKGR